MSALSARACRPYRDAGVALVSRGTCVRSSSRLRPSGERTLRHDQPAERDLRPPRSGLLTIRMTVREREQAPPPIGETHGEHGARRAATAPISNRSTSFTAHADGARSRVPRKKRQEDQQGTVSNMHGLVSHQSTGSREKTRANFRPAGGASAAARRGRSSTAVGRRPTASRMGRQDRRAAQPWRDRRVRGWLRPLRPSRCQPGIADRSRCCHQGGPRRSPRRLRKAGPAATASNGWKIAPNRPPRRDRAITVMQDRTGRRQRRRSRPTSAAMARDAPSGMPGEDNGHVPPRRQHETVRRDNDGVSASLAGLDDATRVRPRPRPTARQPGESHTHRPMAATVSPTCPYAIRRPRRTVPALSVAQDARTRATRVTARTSTRSGGYRRRTQTTVGREAATTPASLTRRARGSGQTRYAGAEARMSGSMRRRRRSPATSVDPGPRPAPDSPEVEAAVARDPRATRSCAAAAQPTTISPVRVFRAHRARQRAHRNRSMITSTHTHSAAAGRLCASASANMLSRTPRRATDRRNAAALLPQPRPGCTATRRAPRRRPSAGTRLASPAICHLPITGAAALGQSKLHALTA